MNDYQRIIVPVDFSKHTDAVLQRALFIARQNHSEVIVLTVIDYAWPTDVDYVMQPVDNVEMKLMEAARERLAQMLNAAGEPCVETRVSVGRPKEEILKLAEQEKADLIVMGAHGHHGLKGLLGSTTDQVTHRARCDVLVVR